MSRTNKGRISLLGSFHRSVLLTYAGIVTAVLGMWLAQTGRLEGALICLVLAGLCDLFDGPVARRFTRTAFARRFGQEIDSLADMVSFVALPVIIAFGMGVQSMWWVPVLAGYALAGLVRLGYFNAVTRTDEPDGDASPPIQYYRGVPVTYAALVLPVAALITTALPTAAGPGIFGGVLALLGLLFVVDVPVRKPRGASYAVFGALAIVIITALAFVEL